MMEKEIRSDFNDIEAFIVRWNIENPMDRWWRKKHNVAFGSPEHREISFIDQYQEWFEDKIYQKAENSLKSQENDLYVADEGQFVKRRYISQTLSDDAFDSISLD